MDCLTQNRTTADGPNPAVAAGWGPATERMSFTWAFATLGGADVDTRVGTTGSLLAALKPNAPSRGRRSSCVPPIRDVLGPHGK